MPTIDLNQENKVKVLAITEASVLACLTTSDAAVFTRGSTDSGQNDLRPGDSMAVKDGMTLVVRIFCSDPDASEFSAHLTLENSAEARMAHLDAVREALALHAAEEPASRAD